MTRTLLNSSSDQKVDFFISKEAGHCSSTKGTGFHILLDFILVKQFRSQIEHVISSLLNFPVILSPQVFMLPPIYFSVSSLKMWEGTRIFIKYHAPCTCHLDSNMKGQNSQPKQMLLVNSGEARGRNYIRQRQMTLMCHHIFRQVSISVCFREGMMQAWHHSTNIFFFGKMPNVFLRNTNNILKPERENWLNYLFNVLQVLKQFIYPI